MEPQSIFRPSYLYVTLFDYKLADLAVHFFFKKKDF